MKFLHISDLHIHTDKSDNKEVTKLLTSIKKNFSEHILIVTGDITDDGSIKQYEIAQDALMPFKDKIFIAPGNHDFGAAGNFFSRDRAERFDQYLSIPLHQDSTFAGSNEPVVNLVTKDDDSVLMIALDTNLETEHPFDFACGEVGEKQLKALNSILSDSTTAATPKILFFHHHPFMHNNPFMEMKDSRPLFRAIYNRVGAILFGHKHVSQLWQNMNGIPYVLAADNSPGKDFVRELEIQGGQISVKDVKIV